MVSLWGIYFPTCSVKSSCFHFRRCGLLFRSQQSSEERNSLCVHVRRGGEGGWGGWGGWGAGGLMNCSVIEMGRVSLLFRWRHDCYCYTLGTGVSSFCWEATGGNCSNMSDQESDDIHREKTIENVQEEKLYILDSWTGCHQWGAKKGVSKDEIRTQNVRKKSLKTS